MREMSRSSGCMCFPSKPWAEELSVCRQTSIKTSIGSIKDGSKGTYLRFFKVMIIPLFIPRKLFRGINLYRDISRSLSNKKIVWLFNDAYDRVFWTYACSDRRSFCEILHGVGRITGSVNCWPRVSDHFAGIKSCQKRVRIHCIVPWMISLVKNGR